MKERMLCGMMYSGMDPDLTKERSVCSLEFLPQVNSTMSDMTKKVSFKKVLQYFSIIIIFKKLIF